MLFVPFNCKKATIFVQIIVYAIFFFNLIITINQTLLVNLNELYEINKNTKK